MRQLSLVPRTVEYPDDFERLWEAFPKRMGDNPKSTAFASYRKALKATDAATIQIAAEEYARAQRHQLGTPYLPMLVTWLNQQRWEAYDPAAVKVDGPIPIEWAWICRMFIKTGKWMSRTPEPGYRGCECPLEIMKSHGIDPKTGKFVATETSQAHNPSSISPLGDFT